LADFLESCGDLSILNLDCFSSYEELVEDEETQDEGEKSARLKFVVIDRFVGCLTELDLSLAE
jgi:hypothetical protein